MANAKKIILGSSLVLAGICSANANTLFQTTELGNTSTIQANLLNVTVHNANALRVAELCCGYTSRISLEDISTREKRLAEAEATLKRQMRLKSQAKLEAAKTEFTVAKFELEDAKRCRNQILEEEAIMLSFKAMVEKSKQEERELLVKKENK